MMQGEDELSNAIIENVPGLKDSPKRFVKHLKIF